MLEQGIADGIGRLGGASLASGVHRHACTTPGAEAVSDADRALCYAELAARAARLAGALESGSAWRRPDGRPPRIGILATRGIDACVAVLAAAWSGAAYVPIGPALPADRIRRLLTRSGLCALVADTDGARRLTPEVLDACPPAVFVAGSVAPRHASRPIVPIDALDGAGPAEPAPADPAHPAYVLFTSGTTGTPKGVVIPNRAVHHAVRSFARHLGLRPHDRVLETCEPTFDFSVHNLFSTWEAGACVQVLPRSRTLDAVRFARETNVSVWNSVPSLVGLLRQLKALTPGSLPSLRLSVFCGEQLSRAAASAWREAAPESAIHNLYGPTEATVFCTGLLLEQPWPTTPGRDWLPIGRPLPGCRAIVFDADGRPVGVGEAGELAIGGIQLADGYLDEPALTQQRFVWRDGERWYLTGDRVTRDPDGLLHWLGRIDNQVKILGHRVELEEIDAHLRALAGTELAATIAWPWSDGSATGAVAFVGLRSIDAERIRAGLRQRLPAHMVPGRVVPLESMPLNGNGKVDRGALRRLLENGLA